MKTLNLSLMLLVATVGTTWAQTGPIPLDDVRIEAGQESATVHEVPWSGSWWPFRSAELAQGHLGHDNYDYDEDAEEFTPIDGIDDADLSPLRKYDLFVERRDGTSPLAAYLELKGDEATGFEHHVYGAKKEQYDADGVGYGWWGHCNGWAAAAVMEREPLSPIEVEGIRFDVADLKGLLTESYWGVRSYFTGRRYNKPSDELQAKVDRGQELLDLLNADADADANADANANTPDPLPPIEDFIAWYEDIYDTTLDESVKANLIPENFRRSLEHVRDWAKENWQDAYEDVYAHVFHKLLVSQIKNRGSGLVFDTSADEEVWNFPAYHYETEITLAEELADGKKRFSVETTVYYGHDGVSESILGVNELIEDYTYDLICDADGRPVDGTWTGSSVDDHPDFAWVPTYNPTGQDRGENPRLLYGKLLEILSVDHAHGAPALELLARLPDGSTERSRDRIEEIEATTWTNPLEVQSPVTLAVDLTGSEITTVRYYRQEIENGSWRPTVARDGLTLLRESTAGGDHAVSLDLAEGKTFVLAYGLNAQGRVVAISELTLRVVAAPPPPPSEDTFEENDSLIQAAAITLGTHDNLLAADDDWFVLDVAEAGTLRVTVTSALDLGVGLFRGVNDAFASGNGALEAPVEAGPVYVRVTPASAGLTGYSLSLEWEAPTPPPADDDAFEENDDRGSAAALSVGTHAIQVNDADWFAISVPDGSRAEVVVRFSNAAGDLDLELTDATGTRLGTSTSVSDVETVSHTASAGATTVYVHVYGYSGATNAATVEVTLETPTVPAGDDAFEENDMREVATVVSLGSYDALRVEDDDWFQIELAAGQTLQVTIAFSHAEGDLDMRLEDANGGVLGSSTSTSDQEQVSTTASQDGTVYLRVYGYSGARAGYSLTLE